MSIRQNKKVSLIFVLVTTLTVFICMPGLASGPVISNVDVIDMIIEPLSSVIVGWETDVPASSQVEYGKTPDYGFNSTVSKRLTLRHQVQLNDLETDMVYFFRVKSSIYLPICY